MRSFSSLILFAALIYHANALGREGCDENLVCAPDAPAVCIFHSENYCFVKYKNQCAWNDIRCKNNLKFEEYALEFCELENFSCPAPAPKKTI